MYFREIFKGILPPLIGLGSRVTREEIDEFEKFMTIERNLGRVDKRTAGAGASELFLIDSVPELAREDPAFYLASVFEQAAALASLANPKEIEGIPYNDFSDSIVSSARFGLLRQVLSAEGVEIAERAAGILCRQLSSRRRVLRVLTEGERQFVKETRAAFTEGAEEAVVAFDRLTRSVRARVVRDGVLLYQGGFEARGGVASEQGVESDVSLVSQTALTIIGEELAERGLSRGDVLDSRERLSKNQAVQDAARDIYEGLKERCGGDYTLLKAGLVEAYRQVKTVFASNRRDRLAYLRLFQSVRGRAAYEKRVGCFSLVETVKEGIQVQGQLRLEGTRAKGRSFWSGVWWGVRVGVPVTAVFLGVLWLGGRVRPDLADVFYQKVGELGREMAQVLDVGPVRTAFGRSEMEPIAGSIDGTSVAVPARASVAGGEVDLIGGLPATDALPMGRGQETPGETTSGEHRGIISTADVFEMIRRAGLLEIEIGGLEDGVIPSNGGDLDSSEGVFRAPIKLVELEDVKTKDGRTLRGKDGKALMEIPDFQNDDLSDNDGELAAHETWRGNIVIPAHNFRFFPPLWGKGAWVDLGDLEKGENIKLFIDGEFAVFKLASIYSVPAKAKFSEVEKGAQDGGALIFVNCHDGGTAFERIVYTFEYVGGDGFPER